MASCGATRPIATIKVLAEMTEVGYLIVEMELHIAGRRSGSLPARRRCAAGTTWAGAAAGAVPPSSA